MGLEGGWCSDNIASILRKLVCIDDEGNKWWTLAVFISGDRSDIKCLCRCNRYEIRSCSSPDCLRCFASGRNSKGFGTAMTELKENTLVLVYLPWATGVIWKTWLTVSNTCDESGTLLPWTSSPDKLQAGEVNNKDCTFHLAFAFNRSFWVRWGMKILYLVLASFALTFALGCWVFCRSGIFFVWLNTLAT